MLRYKFDLIAELKAAGYSSTRIRREKIIGESNMTVIRNGGVVVGGSLIDNVCRILGIQPGDLLEYVPDEEVEQETKQTPEGPSSEDIF